MNVEVIFHGLFISWKKIPWLCTLLLCLDHKQGCIHTAAFSFFIPLFQLELGRTVNKS